MKRNFNNFLESYFKYAVDGFCPDVFHKWTGVSIVAGAMERKCWVRLGKLRIYPNLYILLVSKPGMGKSSAGFIGVTKVLKELEAINFIPTQTNEASLVAAMQKSKKFFYKDYEISHSSGYYYASEASNSIKEHAGGGVIIPMITEFYDCGDSWDKQTIKDGQVVIKNICFNLLAGCTFDFLGELIMDKNVHGGFASRNLFIVHDEVSVRKPKWGSDVDEDTEMHRMLVEDLTQINQLTGPFSATPEVKEAYEKWFPEHDKFRQELASEKLQAFLVRKHTNLLKLCMVFSVSESNSMLIEIKHWKRALAEITKLEEKLPGLISKGNMNKDNQLGINTKIISTLVKAGGELSMSVLRRRVLLMNTDTSKLDRTLQSMYNNQTIDMIKGKQGPSYKLLVDPKDYL